MTAGRKARPLKVGVWLFTGDDDRGDVITEVYASDTDEVKLELALPNEPSIGIYMSRAAAAEVGRQLISPYGGER